MVGYFLIIECWAGVGVTNLLALLTLLGLLGALLLLRLALLEEGLRDDLGGHRDRTGKHCQHSGLRELSPPSGELQHSGILVGDGLECCRSERTKTKNTLAPRGGLSFHQRPASLRCPRWVVVTIKSSRPRTPRSYILMCQALRLTTEGLRPKMYRAGSVSFERTDCALVAPHEAINNASDAHTS